MVCGIVGYFLLVFLKTLLKNSFEERRCYGVRYTKKPFFGSTQTV